MESRLEGEVGGMGVVRIIGRGKWELVGKGGSHRGPHRSSSRPDTLRPDTLPWVWANRPSESEYRSGRPVFCRGIKCTDDSLLLAHNLKRNTNDI